MDEPHEPENMHEVSKMDQARDEFIEQYYSAIFGVEEIGNPSVEVSASDLTTLLMAYEKHLAKYGLLKRED